MITIKEYIWIKGQERGMELNDIYDIYFKRFGKENFNIIFSKPRMNILYNFAEILKLDLNERGVLFNIAGCNDIELSKEELKLFKEMYSYPNI